MNPTVDAEVSFKHLGSNSTTDAIVEPTSSDNGKVKPPDGGRGWLIVFCSFMCNVVLGMCTHDLILDLLYML